MIFNISDVNTRINDQDTSPTYMMVLEVNISKQELFLEVQRALDLLAQKMSVRATIHPVDTLVL